MGKRNSPSYPVGELASSMQQSVGIQGRQSESSLDLQSSATTPLSKPLSLPLELMNNVADFLFEARPPIDESASICCVKPPWSDVQGFINTSHDLRRIGYIRWTSILTVKFPEDWEVVKKYSQWLKELRCTDGVLVSPPRQVVLKHFTHLYALSIDAHSDVARNAQNQFAYRDLFKALPPTLRRLEITRAHGPDVRVIATVKACCPELEELRLGRCTMFNCSPACEFWEAFPFDHDSYMSDQDSDAYAHSLSKELLPLRFLKSLRLGLYLIPSTTVLSHRLFHRRNLPAPEVIEWQQAIPQIQNPPGVATRGQTQELVSLLHQPDSESEFGPFAICAMCVETVEQISKRAEASASAIIQELVPSLEMVQWMSWLSSGHLGLSSYMRLVGRQ